MIHFEKQEEFMKVSSFIVACEVVVVEPEKNKNVPSNEYFKLDKFRKVLYRAC